MAYPSAIKTTGALSTANDIFEYFKVATQTFLEGDYQEEYTSEYWNPNFLQDFTSGANYPITRGQFNTIINNNFPDSADLLSENDPASGWAIDKVNDWAKIKCFQLAIFGSVSGATSQSSLSYITGPRELTNTWRMFDQTYLRLALVRFDTYGTCYQEEDASAPPPTNLVTNVSARTFNWTNASGYPNLSNYEYSIMNGVWRVVDSKPFVVPDLMTVPVGGFAVRTRGVGYYSESDELYNDTEIPSVGIVVTVNVSCEYDGVNMVAHAWCTVNQAMPEDVLIYGTATAHLIGGGTKTFSYDVWVYEGEYDGDSGNYPLSGGPYGDVDYTDIIDGYADPYEVGPLLEEVNVTW